MDRCFAAIAAGQLSPVRRLLLARSGLSSNEKAVVQLPRQPAPAPGRVEGTTKGHENAEGVALGYVRVDLTVRLWRGVEGSDSATACIFGFALYVGVVAQRPGRTQ